MQQRPAGGRGGRAHYQCAEEHRLGGQLGTGWEPCAPPPSFVPLTGAIWQLGGSLAVRRDVGQTEDWSARRWGRAVHSATVMNPALRRATAGRLAYSAQGNARQAVSQALVGNRVLRARHGTSTAASDS